MNDLEIFRWAGAVALATSAAAALLHLLIARPWRHRPDAPPGEPRVHRFSRYERLVHNVTAAAFVALAVTAAWPIVQGRRMAGLWLLAHMVAGGVFAAGAAAMALRWAADHGFDRRDWAIGRAILSHPGCPAGRFDMVQKTFFWLTMVLSLTSIVSVLAAMFPLAGTEPMELLLAGHRYSGLALTVAALLHVYRQLIVRHGSMRGIVTGVVGQGWARRHHSGWAAQTVKKGS